MKIKISDCKNLFFTFFILVGLPSLGSGQVAFTKHTIASNFAGPSSVYSIDVTGDSLIDVLGASGGANAIGLWVNNGGVPVTWSEQMVSSNFSVASSAYAANLDGNGGIDVVGSAWWGNEIAWWRNEGNNPIQWTKQLIASDFNGAQEVYTADIDSDGDCDVLGVAMSLNQIAWWRNDGGNPLQWTKEVLDGSFSGARSVYACDVNDDSLVDVLGAAYTSNKITVWYRNADSSWTEQVIDSNFFGAHKIYAADVDGDDDSDLIGAAHIADDIVWWRNDGGNPVQWTKQFIDDNFDGAISVYAADIDGDDDLDILGGAEVAHDIAVWYNDIGSPAAWTKQIIDGNFTGAWPVHAADIDNDGDMDVLGGASYANEIAWWENEGIVGIPARSDFPGEFKLFRNYPNPFNPTTTIKFQLPQTSQVTLEIYNLIGEKVATLISATQPPGSHSVEWDASNLTSGVYLYRLHAGNRVETGKMVLLK